MSLLEDVFLQDEAGEAQELERIIEGDEYDERPRALSPDSDNNSEKEDEAEEDKRRIDPASAKPKRVVKNPRVVLNPARLTGPRGIQVIPEHFKDFKFKGKGHEKEDMDLVLKKLEHWAYRLYPKFEFSDCLKKIETLGNKRPVTVHLTKIRTDQFMGDGDTVVQRDSSGDEAAPEPVQEEDEFDKLLQQQIDLARATPAPESTRKPAFNTPRVDTSVSMPKATSSPSINEEQRERMLRNRQLAEERRLARLKQNSSQTTTSLDENNQKTPEHDTSIENRMSSIANPLNLNNENKVDTAKFKANATERNEVQLIENKIPDVIDENAKNNISHNTTDSSDEDDTLIINESIAVDVHNSYRDDDSDEEIPDARNTNSDSDKVHSVIEMNGVENSAIEKETGSQHKMIENRVRTEESNNVGAHSDSENIKTDANKIDSLITESSDDSNDNSELVKKYVQEPDTSQQVDDMNVCVNPSKEIEVTIGKDREKQDNVLEDIMDVDFSDDF